VKYSNNIEECLALVKKKKGGFRQLSTPRFKDFSSVMHMEGREGFFSIPRLTAWSFQGVTDGGSQPPPLFPVLTGGGRRAIVKSVQSPLLLPSS